MDTQVPLIQTRRLNDFRGHVFYPGHKIFALWDRVRTRFSLSVVGKCKAQTEPRVMVRALVLAPAGAHFSTKLTLLSSTTAMVKWDKAFIPRAYYDNPVVEPTIKKAFEPMCPGGGAKDQAAADAMDPQYKCVDCNGFRVYGVGNPRKAAVLQSL